MSRWRQPPGEPPPRARLREIKRRRYLGQHHRAAFGGQRLDPLKKQRRCPDQNNPPLALPYRLRGPARGVGAIKDVAERKVGVLGTGRRDQRKPPPDPRI